MPSKSSSDSSKKSKKSDKDGGSGPNKKLKRSSSIEAGADSKSGSTNKDGRKQQTPPPQQVQQAITMTIPRKRDKLESSATVPKKSSKSSNSGDQQKQVSTTPIPKIPKKSVSQSKSSTTSSEKETPSKATKDLKTAKVSKATEKSQVATEKPSKVTSDKSSKSSNKTPSKSNDKGAKKAADKATDATSDASSGADNPSKLPEEIPDNESATTENSSKSAADPSQINKAETNSNSSKGDETNDDDKAEASGSSLASTPEPEKTATSSKNTKKSGDKSSSGSSSSNGGSARRTSIKSQPADKRELTASGTPKPPKIDTSIGIVDVEQLSGRQTPSSSKAKSPTPTAMDNHPYARGSVIEVLHGVSDEAAGDDWWSEDSDEEEEENVGDEDDNETSPKSSKKSSVRLCDVIDRVSIGDKQWRYYVHYRDFNRRMDEWVSMKRIVSPPSIGNAKARAIKKEEERQKRKQQRIEERNAELSAAVDVSAPRASRRRSSMQNPAGVVATSASSTGGDTPVAEGDSETPRRTRLQRKKSTVDDDATVVAANVASGRVAAGETPQAIMTPPAVIAAEKGIVAIPTTAAETHTVGEHVVATIPAQELDEHEGLDEASLREHEEVTKVKNVAFVELGPYQMETWYFSPLPKELLSEKGFIEVLYVCEFTFSLFSRKSELQRFQSRLPTHLRHPPGNEIYRNGNLAMFEVDGFQERIYCQNLCYIAKLFLDHKTLYFDVDPFLFYVLCEVDNRGFHPVGYYSKEKYSDVGYNLACILTFPSHQRKGYGRFLIAFSYELSKKEEKVGSPEKPMSDLGQQAYKPYWNSTIVDFLLNQSPDSSSMSIMDISKQTSIMAEDIVFTLNQLGILKIINGVYFVSAQKELLEKLAKKFPVKDPKVDPSKLHWTPFATDVKRDKFSIHSKKPSVEDEETRGSGGFP